MKKIITLFVGTIISVGAFAQWDTLSTHCHVNFNSIAFTSLDSGIMVGKNATTGFGEMRMTSDGGINFTTPIYSGSRPGFNAITFTADGKGWVAGDSGYVFISNDHGFTWTTLTRFTIKNLYAISFLNDSTGFVGGANGCLYRTNDRGLTWDTLNSQTSLPIRTILCDPLRGVYIAGDGGYIAYSNDLGNTWNFMSNYYSGFLNVHDMAITPHIPVNDFTAVGNSGMMVNGALFSAAPTLTQGSFNRNNDINGIASKNLSIIICGNSGLIGRSLDNVNWTIDSVGGTFENLHDVCYAGNSTAYICGDNGRVLKSNVDISSVSSSPENNLAISAFPNPFEGELNLEMNLENSSNVQIEIMDVAGRIVLQENEGEIFAGKNIFHVNGISSLTTGMYFARVITENGIATLPVVKK